MKKFIYTLVTILVSSLSFAQTQTENYIKNTTYSKAFTDLSIATDNDKIETITYYDGLGRPKQVVNLRAGGDKQDIITHIEYDAFGRQAKDYLPYATATNSGQIAPNPIQELESFYFTAKYENTLNPFSEKEFEASPLNRVLKQAAPGEDWKLGSGNEIEFDYQTNTATEVKLYKVALSFSSNTYTPTLTGGSSNYVAGELYKTITRDENHTGGVTVKDHTTEEFKDKQGRVILKRTYNNEIKHDTYYVYDDYGNLTYVLPPKAEPSTAKPDATELKDLCYQYKYDHRNRLVEKKIPGKGREYIIYDKLDRPILTQDANQHNKNPKEWLFIKYDAFGRVVYTGKYNNDGTRTSLQNLVTNGIDNGTYAINETRTTTPTSIGSDSSTELYYSSNAFPNAGVRTIYTINYYDDYSWDVNQDMQSNSEMAYLSSGLSQSGSTITKTGGSCWITGFKTEGVIENDGYISFTAAQNNKLMIGLSKITSAPNDHYNTIDYAIYLHSNGRVYIREEGINKPIKAYYYQAGDTFRVERVEGHRIVYRKNGEIIFGSATYVTEPLLGDSSFCHNGGAVNNVHIGYSAMGVDFNTSAKGLVTGSKVRVLGSSNWITSTNYYDDKGRPIYSSSTNDYLNTVDVAQSKLDFVGKALKSQSFHTKDGQNTIRTTDDLKYDHTGRLLTQIQQINELEQELIVSNHYDELGQLYQKGVGGTLKTSTYTNTLGVSVSNTIIKKTAASGWANAGLSTQKTISGNGYIGFIPLQSNSPFMVGLSYSDTNQHYNTIKYAIYCASQGRLFIYESGSNKGLKESYVPGDRLAVERRDNTIYYLKNEKVFYTSSIATTNASMLGDVSLYSINTQIKDLKLVDLETQLQEVDFTYNVRGWLKGINDVSSLGNDLFSFKINYNEKELSAANNFVPLYNGNIAETHWKTSNDYRKRSYNYKYDALNRLNTGQYWEPGGSNATNSFNEVLDYDKNGNILNLERTSAHPVNGNVQYIDNLTYTYNVDNQSNQLVQVDDTISNTNDNNRGFKDGTNSDNDYNYDDNGNMITDANKEITSITYNHLNLPTQILIGSNNYLVYHYDALGNKLAKFVIPEGGVGPGGITTTQYAGNYIYEDTGQGSQLKFFNHTEGYIEPTFGESLPLTLFNVDYVYQYKDHLGNIRLSYSDADNSGDVDASEILEENNYYPFGLEHKGYNNVVNGTEHPYKYHGKEHQQELGLNWYDFSARNYDPALGRWMNLDPLAEKMRRHSPYNFAFDNPIYFQDPDGMMPCPTGDCTDPPNGNGANQMNRGNSSAPVGDSSNPSSSHSRGSVGSSTATGTDVVRSVAVEGAYTGIQSDRVRNQYKSTVSNLDVGDSKGRTQAKLDARAKTPAVTKAIVESSRPTSGEVKKTSGTANKTNAGANNTAKNIGRAGKGLLVVGVVASANNIANAENKVEAVATEGGAWAGAIAGGEILGTAGATFGPWGAAGGAVVGSIVGGFAGEKAVESIIENIKNPEPRAPMTAHDRICFVEGTQITMSDFRTKNIEDVKNGDIIKTYNVENGKIENKEVLLVESSTSETFVEIEFEDGTKNINTLTHPYYIKNKGWSSYDNKEAIKKYGINVNSIKEGDIAYKVSNDNTILEVRIIKIKIINKTRKTYNVSNVKDNHNFFANGLLVHNRS